MPAFFRLQSEFVVVVGTDWMASDRNRSHQHWPPGRFRAAFLPIISGCEEELGLALVTRRMVRKEIAGGRGLYYIKKRNIKR